MPSTGKEKISRLSHYGGASGVTGSCHRLDIGESHSLLIDCGLFQGEGLKDSSSFEQHEVHFDIEKIRAVILTHVHIDHVGRLPWLLAAGYKGPILVSGPTKVLLPLVIEDALKVGFTRNERLIRKFLKQIKSQLVSIEYNSWHTILDDNDDRIKVRLQRAGHILGSSYVETEIVRKKDKKTERIVFSGDLGAPWTPLLYAPKSPWRADRLVLESTYGDRHHDQRKSRSQGLKQAIEKAMADKGSVIIPAFSIGRTQELLYELEGIINRENSFWGKLEIIVDSPLASRFTETYRQLMPYWDNESRKRIRQGRHPLSFDNLTTIKDHNEHLQTVEYLAATCRPAIVIAASGMATGGRVVNYLKSMLRDERHQVLFIGYQAQGTPGRSIQKYGPEGGWVEFDGKRYDIRAGVETISGYSAHADQRNLLNFIRRMRHWPCEISLVHGDTEARKALKVKIEQMYRQFGKQVKVELPDNE